MISFIEKKNSNLILWSDQIELYQKLGFTPTIVSIGTTQAHLQRRSPKYRPDQQ